MKSETAESLCKEEKLKSILSNINTEQHSRQTIDSSYCGSSLYPGSELRELIISKRESNYYLRKDQRRVSRMTTIYKADEPLTRIQKDSRSKEDKNTVKFNLSFIRLLCKRKRTKLTSKYKFKHDKDILIKNKNIEVCAREK